MSGHKRGRPRSEPFSCELDCFNCKYPDCKHPNPPSVHYSNDWADDEEYYERNKSTIQRKKREYYYQNREEVLKRQRERRRLASKS